MKIYKVPRWKTHPEQDDSGGHFVIDGTDTLILNKGGTGIEIQKEACDMVDGCVRVQNFYIEGLVDNSFRGKLSKTLRILKFIWGE